MWKKMHQERQISVQNSVPVGLNPGFAFELLLEHTDEASGATCAPLERRHHV